MGDIAKVVADAYFSALALSFLFILLVISGIVVALLVRRTRKRRAEKIAQHQALAEAIPVAEEV